MIASPKPADPALLVISAAPASRQGGKLLLDKKFVEGMQLYASHWKGRIGCLLPESFSPQPFGKLFDPAALSFEVDTYPAQHFLTANDLGNYDVVLCSGDNDQYLHLSDVCLKFRKKIIYTIEYIPETRRQIVMLDTSKSLLRKLRSLLHIQMSEGRRRRAFAQAAALQANGFPASDHYKNINPEMLFYLDSRIDSNLLATSDDMVKRSDRLSAGDPIRLLHSGRLEPLKGSQDIVPIARCLKDRNVDFVLDVFGSGSLEDKIRAEVLAADLKDQVCIHGAVDFATELVPFARKNSDIYISCHPQSDPSCTYLESMGCGLAVAGYSNRMWKALAEKSKAGWTVSVGDWRGLADVLSSLGRQEIIDRCNNARDFAETHLFQHEFEKRIAHFRKVAGTV